MLNGEPGPGSDPQTGPVNIQTLKCLPLAPTVSHNHRLFQHHLNIYVCDNSNRSKCVSSRLVLFDASTERQLQQIPKRYIICWSVRKSCDSWLWRLVCTAVSRLQYQHLPEYSLIQTTLFPNLNLTCKVTRMAVWQHNACNVLVVLPEK